MGCGCRVIIAVRVSAYECHHAPPHRLPYLRFRHPVRFHRARHDHADAAVARRVLPHGFGEETTLIEMPISWSLDDHPHFEFIRTPQTVTPGLRPAREVMQSWHDEFLYMKKTVDWGVLTYTMHPYVIGRGYRMLALESLLKDLIAAGAVFMNLEDAAREAQARMFAP